MIPVGKKASISIFADSFFSKIFAGLVLFANDSGLAGALARNAWGRGCDGWWYRYRFYNEGFHQTWLFYDIFGFLVKWFLTISAFVVVLIILLIRLLLKIIWARGRTLIILKWQLPIILVVWPSWSIRVARAIIFTLRGIIGQLLFFVPWFFGDEAGASTLWLLLGIIWI